MFGLIPTIHSPFRSAAIALVGALLLVPVPHLSALGAPLVADTDGDASNCDGVTVPSTTTNLQGVVNAYPEGTTFCFQPGNYWLDRPVTAKSGDRFIGQSGATLDGQNAVTRGIWGYGGSNGQNNVTVQGLTFVNFTDAAIVTGWSWTVSQNDIHDSRIGVIINSYSTLDSNYLHDNWQYGLSGGPLTNVLIVNNEVARNNVSNCGGACINDAGGSKIIGSSMGTYNLTWRNNYIHDNLGAGIFSDGNVHGALYEGNTVWNNSASGIQHEISWDAIIRYNYVSSNAWDSAGRSCWWGANILINTSTNVEVSDNTIVGSNGSNGICAVSSDRGEVAPYPTVVANFYAHDNIVAMSGSATSGLVGYAGSNNRFVQNTYYVTDASGAWWTWPTAYTAVWDAWRGGAGQDTDGILVLW
jgi:hypothetical protein